MKRNSNIKLSRLKSKKGFTLVECLVALMVFAIMAGMLFMILSAAIQTSGENYKLDNDIEKEAVKVAGYKDTSMNTSNAKELLLQFNDGSSDVLLEQDIERKKSNNTSDGVNIGYFVHGISDAVGGGGGGGGRGAITGNTRISGSRNIYFVKGASLDGNLDIEITREADTIVGAYTKHNFKVKLTKRGNGDFPIHKLTFDVHVDLEVATAGVTLDGRTIIAEWSPGDVSSKVFYISSLNSFDFTTVKTVGNLAVDIGAVEANGKQKVTVTINDTNPEQKPARQLKLHFKEQVVLDVDTGVSQLDEMTVRLDWTGTFNGTKVFYITPTTVVDKSDFHVCLSSTKGIYREE